MNKYIENLNCSWTSDSERLFVTPSNELKNILFYVQETGKFSTYRPYFTEREGIDSYLILLTLAGGGSLEYENNHYDLNAGDIFFIDCRKYHKYCTRTERNWDFLWVHFNGATAQGCHNYFSAQNAGPIAKIRSQEAEKLMNELNEVNRRPAPQSDIVSFRILSALIAELLLLKNPATYTMNTVPERMLKILAEIDKLFCSRLSLQTLAQKFGIDKYVLCREFKKYFGIGFKEYVTAKRITRAKELLRFSDHTIAEISELLGYENPEYFISLFKTYEHTTPLAFRKNWQNTAHK